MWPKILDFRRHGHAAGVEVLGATPRSGGPSVPSGVKIMRHGRQSSFSRRACPPWVGREDGGLARRIAKVASIRPTTGAQSSAGRASHRCHKCIGGLGNLCAVRARQEMAEASAEHVLTPRCAKKNGTIESALVSATYVRNCVGPVVRVRSSTRFRQRDCFLFIPKPRVGPRTGERVGGQGWRPKMAVV